MRGKRLITALVLVVCLLAVALWRTTAASRRAPAEPAVAAPVVTPPAAPAPRASPTLAPPEAKPARPPAPAGPLTERQLMDRLRKVKEADPALAIELAREGRRRFGESADAPEREAILIHALVAVDRASEARGEAEDMVNRYPVDSPWVRDVERFTGAHPHRDVHVTDAGQIYRR